KYFTNKFFIGATITICKRKHEETFDRI
ncbi:uncharacterized protein CDAR_300831, partial [Caerostris darwini]